MAHSRPSVFVKNMGQFEDIVALVNVEFELILILEALATALAQVSATLRSAGRAPTPTFF